MELFILSEKSPALVQSKVNGNPISSLRLKRGAHIPISVTILGTKPAAQLKFGTKAKNDYEGELLVYGEAGEGKATNGGTIFEMELHVSSSSLDSLFNVGNGGKTSPSTIPAISEFSWIEDGKERLSDTLTSTILNDILRQAEEPPSSLVGSYPAPELVATRSWVNALRASALNYGLVLLESDAIWEGAHTSVVVTKNGSIAIPRATSSIAGTILLGTDNILTGKYLLPLGCDSEGHACVNAAGITAYHLAVKEGFEGTEQEWLASLKGDQGEQGAPGQTPDIEDIVSEAVELVTAPKATDKIKTTCTGTHNADFNWTQLNSTHCPVGAIKSIEMPCRIDHKDELTFLPVYVTVWEYDATIGEWVYRATSTNAQTQVVGGKCRWLFNSLRLTGKDIRICPVPDRNTLWDESTLLGGRVIYCSDGVESGCKLFYNKTISNLLLQVKFEYSEDYYRFAPVEHVHDTTLHLTSTEHAGLTALLAKKNALLALVNS